MEKEKENCFSLFPQILFITDSFDGPREGYCSYRGLVCAFKMSEDADSQPLTYQEYLRLCANSDNLSDINIFDADDLIDFDTRHPPLEMVEGRTYWLCFPRKFSIYRLDDAEVAKFRTFHRALGNARNISKYYQVPTQVVLRLYPLPCPFPWLFSNPVILATNVTKFLSGDMSNSPI